MRRISLLALLLIVVSVLPVQAARGRSGLEQEVLRDFEQILDLWRDGSYGDLFDRTAGGKASKELFAKKLASAPRKPACCWEKMQDARVSLKGERAATVRARLGFEGGASGTEFVTRGIKLKKEGDVWVISQSDLFSLADLSKKRARYKYLPIQPK
jgi:hypothetical protein